ncbi:phosphonoacetaldehyde hydrolase [Cetobacterium sp. 2A]|uniref:phosphonoacetaldehyde hydrolase n=1 Tax=Cetobacterium sp. 2A TaxID=2754723 RepID=UPI00163C2FEA|nr:phosphonoacetaldehyde hydrolase [Cetobacterium sp. 2A]
MKRIEGVIFDWAGTTVDYGCFAPVKVFLDIFKDKGIEPTIEEARGPMGMLKIDHVIAMLSVERISNLWKEKYGRNWNEDDVNLLYFNFEKQLFEILPDFTTPVPGILELIKRLREKGLKIGSTTGYTRKMMDIVEKHAKEKGYSPDFLSTPSNQPAGRPHPYMILENMKVLKLNNPECVIKVGDTVSDIKEGVNAKCWSVGILKGSSELGLTEEEVINMPKDELNEKLEVVRRRFLDNGAHFIIEEVGCLDEIINQINEKLLRGERP